MNLSDKLKELFSNFYHWFKPKEIEKSECVLQLLKTLYPKVNWNNVHFHNRLPWFIPSSQVIAITLPGIYSFNQIHIYFNNNFDPCNYRGLGTIVHEGLHVLQYRDTGNVGLGFIRLFMVEYLGSWTMFGYSNSSMEVDAREQEVEFNKCCKTLNKKICDCSTNPPTFNQDALNQLIASSPNLVKNTSGYHFNFDIFLAIFGVILDLIIAILLPILELVLLLIVALLLVITGLLRGIIWLWNTFAKLFRRK